MHHVRKKHGFSISENMIYTFLYSSLISITLANDLLLQQPKICGVPTYQPNSHVFSHITRETNENKWRVIGGEQANLNSWPWQVRLNMGYDCGGAIIDDYWVLTAAHCISSPTGYAWVRAHYHLAAADDPLLGRRIRVSGVIRHPDYNPSTFENDIAILKLAEPAIDRDSNNDFDFSKTSPICLPHKNTCFSPDTPCVVTGWGISDTDMWYREDYLQEVGVRIMNNAECQQHPTYQAYFKPDIMLCAGYTKGDKDACAGDSGGPLVCRVPMEDGSGNLDNQWVLMGLVSWGLGCAQAGKPGVYANVPYFSEWISQTIEENSGDIIKSHNYFDIDQCYNWDLNLESVWKNNVETTWSDPETNGPNNLIAKEGLMKFQKAYFFNEENGGSGVKKCDASVAIDGFSPNNMEGNSKSYFNSLEEQGACFSGSGDSGETLLLTLSKENQRVTKFHIYPGHKPEQSYGLWAAGKVHVCSTADFKKENCFECRKTGKGKAAKRPPKNYPESGFAVFQCPEKAIGRYVKVRVPPVSGKKIGVKKYAGKAYLSIIEIEAFGYEIPIQPQACECENGQPSLNTNCIIKCTSCFPGFHLDPTTTKCVENICTCENGVGATGLDCPDQSKSNCLSCNNGSYLKNGQCVESNQLCLKKMFSDLDASFIQGFDSISVSWINSVSGQVVNINENDGVIEISHATSGSDSIGVKFNNTKITEYTVQTGVPSLASLVANDRPENSEIETDALIGWQPFNKLCPGKTATENRPSGPGLCNGMKCSKRDNTCGVKNSGIGQSSNKEWQFEGYTDKKSLRKTGQFWDKGMKLLTAKIEKREDQSQWPGIKMVHGDGQIDSWVMPKKRQSRYPWVDWPSMVPIIGVRPGTTVRIVDAECNLN